AEPAEAVAAPATFRCPACDSEGPAGQAFCGDCGYYFSPADLAAGAPGAEAAPATGAVRLKDRYELRELISDRLGVQRYRALDPGEDGEQAVPVVVIRQALPQAPPPEEPAEPASATEESDEVLPTFDDPEDDLSSQTHVLTVPAPWPSITWERR